MLDVLSREHTTTTPNRIDDASRTVRKLMHPTISIEPGYDGYIVLGNREPGKAIGVTLWDSAAESDEKAREIRPRAEEATGGGMQSVEKYEVLFFDLPESKN